MNKIKQNEKRDLRINRTTWSKDNEVDLDRRVPEKVGLFTQMKIKFGKE